MAGASDNPSRRDVLGAAVAIPFLPLEGGGQVGVAVGLGDVLASQSSTAESTPPLTPPPRGEGNWHRALADYRAAEAGVEEAGRLCSALRPGSGQASRAEAFAAEEAFGDRLEALYEALRRMLVVPAPDVAAFLVKVDAAFEHEISTLCDSDASIAAIRADVRRLRGAHS